MVMTILEQMENGTEESYFLCNFGEFYYIQKLEQKRIKQ